MLEALNSIGVNYKLLIAQLVNFILLFIILYKFLYRPVLKILNERSSKISKSLDDAKKVEARLVTVEQEIEQKLVDADNKTNAIIAEAKEQSIALDKNMHDEAKKKVDRIIDQAKLDIVSQKKMMLAEVQSEVADLVSEALKLIANDKSVAIDKKTIGDTVIQIKKAKSDG
ncbi:MAG: F0F1 ATP synthase subunit B [Candidatus Saccharibacteria bacterium]